jgi:hypothetical protein
LWWRELSSAPPSRSDIFALLLRSDVWSRAVINPLSSTVSPLFASRRVCVLPRFSVCGELCIDLHLLFCLPRHCASFVVFVCSFRSRCGFMPMQWLRLFEVMLCNPDGGTRSLPGAGSAIHTSLPFVRV